MTPLVRACIALAVLAALAATSSRSLDPVDAQPGLEGARHAPSPLLRPCPPNTLLDNQVCVPAPTVGSPSASGKPQHWQVYDRLPRRPERPASYARYQLPLAASETIQASPFLGEEQLSGDAVLLGSPTGTQVKLVRLDKQQGPSAVLYTGTLVGSSVVTEHQVLEGARPQVYIVVYGNLASLNVKAGTHLNASAVLGTSGNSAAGHAMGLHLEVRRVRHGVDPRALSPADYRSRAHTVASDLRNVFPLKQ